MSQLPNPGYLFDRTAYIPVWLVWEGHRAGVLTPFGVFTSRGLAMHKIRDKYPNELIEFKKRGDLWTGFATCGYWILVPIVLDQELN